MTSPSPEEEKKNNKLDIPILEIFNEATLHVDLLGIPQTSPKRIEQMVKYVNYHYSECDFIECTNCNCINCIHDIYENNAIENNAIVCQYCNISNIKLMSCLYCPLIKYCSKKCQKSDWKKNHKLICKYVIKIY